jgi:hypothetical protein
MYFFYKILNISFMKNLIYLLNESGSQKYKIGITTTNGLDKRLKAIQTGCPEKIEVIKTFESPFVSIIEKNLHRLHKTKNTNGEWFILSDDDVASFTLKCQLFNDAIQNLVESDNVFMKKRLNI